MDNLCHTLVGGVLAECGLKRRTPRATATLLIAANLPDIDAVAAFTSYGRTNASLVFKAFNP